MCHLPDEEEVVILLYLKEVSQGWKSLSTNMYIWVVLIFVYLSPYLPDLDNGKLAELDSGCFWSHSRRLLVFGGVLEGGGYIRPPPSSRPLFIMKLLLLITIGLFAHTARWPDTNTIDWRVKDKPKGGNNYRMFERGGHRWMILSFSVLDLLSQNYMF